MANVLSRTHVGLAIRPESLCAIKVRHGWRRLSVQDVVDCSLPLGVIVPSVNEVNITNFESCVEYLQKMRRSVKSRKIALSLPDNCASMGVFGFESFPSGEKERRALLQWRFRHEMNREVGDSRIESRVFHVPPHLRSSVTPAGSTEQVATYVLAVAVKQPILEQILSACENAGFLAVSVGIGSLQLFDAVRNQIPHAVDHHFVALASDSSTLIAFRQGVPVFLRHRPRRGASGVYAEWITALQFIVDQFPRSDDMKLLGAPVYLVGEELQEKHPEVHRPIKIIRLQLCGDGKCVQSQVSSMARLCALASAVVG